MSITPYYILYQIQEAKAENRKRLDLFGRFYQKKLTKIPREVFELDHLEELDLRDHTITIIPDQIKQLRQLKILDLRGNPLEQITDINGLILDFEIYQRLKTQLVPAQISGLKVKLAGNELPSDLFELSNLTRLDLSRNQLSDLPESIIRLRRLTELNLSMNKLSSVPESITHLRHLTGLDLSHNKLSSMPESITRLQQLTKLYLDSNQLSELPESITHLEQLTYLDLERNRLNSLPESITRLQHLNALLLDGNPLESPPFEVARKGVEKIREYFRQVEEEGIDHLYEAKLLIVGEGGAGKTTLAKKIEDCDYVLQQDEASTKGIDVITWHFPLENRGKFRVNIWDFGGQEIYHATHQFFLTKRSLYALVADTRQENTDFYYWLNAVELLANDSPLLIIKNEKQDRHREINDRQLRGEFSNLKNTLATNLATNRGLSEVLDEIQYYIRKLPHVGSPLPKTWVKVRDALEDDERHYIILDYYLELCDRHGFKRHEDKLQLSGYLHDLGVCLHFQDNGILKHYLIIKPNWATDAVYSVLDNQEVIDKQGKFSKDDLAKIWNQQKYATMHDELLQLMLKFQLCYQIEHTDKYIAPQLLSLNQPRYEWNDANNLLLRYEYDFMPKGIMTRFIVAMHDLIWEQRYVWRSGVILQDKQTKTKAEVIEHYGKRKINVRVVGQQKKELMRLVRYQLERIHRSFQRLKYQKLVQCHCERCSKEQDPAFYNHDELLRFRIDGQPEIQCRKSYKMVDVLSLIDDVGRIRVDERRREGYVNPETPPLPPHTQPLPTPVRNDQSDSQTESPDDNVPEKNWLDVGQEYASKLHFSSIFLGFVLAVWSGLVTVLPLIEADKIRLTWIVIFISLILTILAFMWKKSQRAIWIRVGDGFLSFLITLGLVFWGLPPNVENNCPNVTLKVEPEHIKPGQTAQLDASAIDPDNDSLNYTWIIQGLDDRDGPHLNPIKVYTAPLILEGGEKITITVEVDDNHCGKKITDEVTITILSP